MEAKKVDMFNLEDFVDSIKLSSKVLDHMEYTGNDFDNYLKTIRNTLGNNNYDIMYAWLDNALDELISSNDIENNKLFFSYKELLEGNLFFDTTYITEKRIKDVHSFVASHSDGDISLVGKYRNTPVWMGYYNQDGEKVVGAYGAEAKDISSFMKMLIKYANSNKLSSTYSNPFIKSAIIHLLLVKIHPFVDGNGRTARIVHNLAFTDTVNDIYRTNLKLSPLSISKNIQLTKHDYISRLNNINFDLKSDNYEAFNRWFDYILNMYDEQIYFQTNRINQLEGMSLIQSNYGIDKEDVTNSSSFKRILNKSKVNRIVR